MPLCRLHLIAEDWEVRISVLQQYLIRVDRTNLDCRLRQTISSCQSVRLIRERGRAHRNQQRQQGSVEAVSTSNCIIECPGLQRYRGLCDTSCPLLLVVLSHRLRVIMRAALNASVRIRTLPNPYGIQTDSSGRCSMQSCYS